MRYSIYLILSVCVHGWSGNRIKTRAGTELDAFSMSFDNRRNFLVQAGGGAFATFLSNPVWAATSSPRTMVVTGGNSGLGLEGCKRLAAQGHKLILACRTLDKANVVAETLKGYGGTIVPAECDLASMKSIENFVKGLDVPSVDVLCLNAGIARNTAATDCARTQDGFELTVGVNHFGHFYLNELLMPKMSKGGKIVVTASGVHDPESPGGAQGVPATLGNLSGLEKEGRVCEMLDGEAFNADKAYKDSKLCNVLYVRELQRRLDSRGIDIAVNCFNPGLIVTTGLFRDQNQVFTKVFDVAATNLLKVAETPAWGGGCLAYMTTVDTKGKYYSSPPGTAQKYGDAALGREFTVDTVSKEANDDAKATRLWELSEKALGIRTSV